MLNKLILKNEIARNVISNYCKLTFKLNEQTKPQTLKNSNCEKTQDENIQKNCIKTMQLLKIFTRYN